MGQIEDHVYAFERATVELYKHIVLTSGRGVSEELKGRIKLSEQQLKLAIDCMKSSELESEDSLTAGLSEENREWLKSLVDDVFESGLKHLSPAPSGLHGTHRFRVVLRRVNVVSKRFLVGLLVQFHNSVVHLSMEVNEGWEWVEIGSRLVLQENQDADILVSSIKSVNSFLDELSQKSALCGAKYNVCGLKVHGGKYV